MRNVFLCILLLTISQFVAAEIIVGFPTEIQTTSEGIQFKLNCGPSELTVFKEVKTLFYHFREKLESIHCDVKRNSNPFLKCSSSSEAVSSCLDGVPKAVSLHSSRSNYLAIIQLLSTAYLSQNALIFNLTPTGYSKIEESYDLNSLSLK